MRARPLGWVAVGVLVAACHQAAPVRGDRTAPRDTTGRSAGAVREPWSAYTVEGLFDAIERPARRDDVVEVSYDACLGYPTSLRGDIKVGRFDDWYWVTAALLTPRC